MPYQIRAGQAIRVQKLNFLGNIGIKKYLYYQNSLPAVVSSRGRFWRDSRTSRSCRSCSSRPSSDLFRCLSERLSERLVGLQGAGRLLVSWDCEDVILRLGGGRNLWKRHQLASGRSHLGSWSSDRRLSSGRRQSFGGSTTSDRGWRDHSGRGHSVEFKKVLVNFCD